MAPNLLGFLRAQLLTPPPARPLKDVDDAPAPCATASAEPLPPPTTDAALSPAERGALIRSTKEHELRVLNYLVYEHLREQIYQGALEAFAAEVRPARTNVGSFARGGH